MSVSRDGFYLVIAALAHAATINGDRDEQFVFSNHLFAWAMIYTAQIVAVGGELIQLNIFGIMASGIWPTGFLNSLIRSLDKMISGAPSSASVGDDNNSAHEPRTRDSGDLGSGVRVKSAKDSEGNVIKVNGQVQKARRVASVEGPHETTSFEFEKVDGQWNSKFLGFNRLVARLFLKTNPETATEESPPNADSTLSFRFILRQPATLLICRNSRRRFMSRKAGIGVTTAPPASRLTCRTLFTPFTLFTLSIVHVLKSISRTSSDKATKQHSVTIQIRTVERLYYQHYYYYHHHYYYYHYYYYYYCYYYCYYYY